MRALILAICLSLGLAGCSTTSNGPVISPLDPAVISQIQTGVQTACSFVPTAKTVGDIIASFWGAGGAVDVVANAIQGICGAVTAKGVKRGGAHYRGVKIEGRFVR